MDVRRWGPLAFVLLMVLSFATSSAAQTEAASLSGRLTDPSGGAVPNVQVELTNIDTNIRTTTTTNGEGLYAFSNVRPGRYRLTITKEGFKQIAKADIVLSVQDIIALNFALEIGSVNETVTVLGGTPLVNTESAAVSTVVDRRFVENMPLNGRSFQSLITLTPGVVLVPASFNEQGQFSINGQRPDANYFTVDGVSANIGVTGGLGLAQTAGGAQPGFTAQGGTNGLVSIDAMQEFRIQTSSFAPEFGRTPGGQISIATRSGTNQFHGTVFDYFRNDVLDAKDWFANRNGLRKPQERQNDFGVVLGGPIIKERTFFFFSYEGLRLRQPQTQTTFVPSTASRQAAPSQIQPFLNAFPVSPAPDLGSGYSQFSASYSNRSVLDAASIRVDHVFNSKFMMFGRYGRSSSETATRGPNMVLSHVAVVQVDTQILTLGLTYNMVGNISNELRANYSNARSRSVDHLDNFGGAVPLPVSLLFPATVSPADSQFSLNLRDVSETMSTGLNSVNEQRQVNLLDNLSAAIGAHQFKFGVDYRWLAPFAKPSSYTQFPAFSGMRGTTGAVTGVALLDFISARQEAVLLSRNFSAYIQDTWRITPRFMLTYGLRWDINPALKGKNSSSDPFTVQGLSNPATMALAPRGTPLYETTYGNVAPRVGIAYEVIRRQNWGTVLRGGLGVFYDLGSGALGNLTVQFPFSASKTLTNVPFPLTASQVAAPALSVTPPVTAITVAEPNLKLPRTYHWNIAVEQSVGASQAVSATYVAALGRDLLRQDALVNPNANFGTVSVTRNTATSDYHSLQLKFQRRLSRGLQGLISYTWSHSLDIASSDFPVTNTPATLGTHLDRGNSNFDVRHALSCAVTYDLPSGSGSGFGRAILRGWSVDNLVTARSALPVNVSGPTFVVAGTLFTARPSLVPATPLYLFGSQYPGGKAFNRAAFVNPSTGQQGNFGRNVLRAFGAWQDDFTLRRQFHVTEKVGVQFRAELFNIFNHPNFGNPADTLTNLLFGQSTQMLGRFLGSGGLQGGFSPLYQIGGPRSIQLAIKLTF